MTKCRFARGDRVILVHQHPQMGLHGIVQEDFGTEFEVIKSHEEYYGRGPYYYIGRSRDVYEWGVYECMLELVAPLTPFDILVRSYIQRELPNGSGR